jgi:hypothetical protein
VILKRIDVLSLGKISALLHAVAGLCAGLFFSAMWLFVSNFAPTQNPEQARFFSLFFGGAAIFFMPIFYAVLGFIAGILAAFFYNVFAGWLGGVELEFESEGQGQLNPPAL